MRCDIIVLLLGVCSLSLGLKVRLCANHFCTEPLYKAVALDDVLTTTPGFLQVAKGAPITVYGVEGQYFDAESNGARGFILKDNAEIAQILQEPSTEFNPFYKEPETPITNGSKDPLDPEVNPTDTPTDTPTTELPDTPAKPAEDTHAKKPAENDAKQHEHRHQDIEDSLQYDEEDVTGEYDGLVFDKGQPVDPNRSDPEPKEIKMTQEEAAQEMEKQLREAEERTREERVKMEELKRLALEEIEKNKFEEEEKKKQFEEKLLKKLEEEAEATRQFQEQVEAAKRLEEEDRASAKAAEKARRIQEEAEKARIEEERKADERKHAEEKERMRIEREEKDREDRRVAEAKRVEEEKRKIEAQRLEKEEEQRKKDEAQAAEEDKQRRIADIKAKEQKFLEEQRAIRERVKEEKKKREEKKERKEKEKKEKREKEEAALAKQRDEEFRALQAKRAAESLRIQQIKIAEEAARKIAEEEAQKKAEEEAIKIAEMEDDVGDDDEKDWEDEDEEGAEDGTPKQVPVEPVVEATVETEAEPVGAATISEAVKSHRGGQEQCDTDECKTAAAQSDAAAEPPAAAQPEQSPEPFVEPVVEPAVEQPAVDPVAQAVAEKNVEKPVAQVEEDLGEPPVYDPPAEQAELPAEPHDPKPQPQPELDSEVPPEHAAEPEKVLKPITAEEQFHNTEPEQPSESEPIGPPVVEPAADTAEPAADAAEPVKEVVKEPSDDDDDLGFSGYAETNDERANVQATPQPYYETAIKEDEEGKKQEEEIKKRRDDELRKEMEERREKKRREQQEVVESKFVQTKSDRPSYCNMLIISSLCDTVGADAAILVLLTLLVPLALIMVFFFTSPGSAPQEVQKGPIKVEPDPKVLESLQKQEKSQAQLAGHIDDVSTKLGGITHQLKTFHKDNSDTMKQLEEVHKDLHKSTERNIQLEQQRAALKSDNDTLKRYNDGFEKLEKNLKHSITELEARIEDREEIIEAQRQSNLSTTDQVAALQTQLAGALKDKSSVESELQSAKINQEELATELSLTKERLEITSELHDQSLEDTESWTVRVQILALELAEANTQVSSLEQSLVKKQADIDVLRDCLVDIRDASEDDRSFDFESHFTDMIDVKTYRTQNNILTTNLREMREDLDEVTEARDLFEERIVELEEELKEAQTHTEEVERKKVELSTKLETLSTYFKDKEDELHCRLSELQVKCKALEEENAEANILFYKDELSKLKKSHAETERKLTLLNQTNERKAKEAYSQLRKKDEKLREVMEQLKKVKKGGNIIPEDAPTGPPWLDFPIKKSTDSPSESSLTSAEDLEKRNRRNVEDRGDHPYDGGYDQRMYPPYDGRGYPAMYYDGPYHAPNEGPYPRDYPSYDQREEFHSRDSRDDVREHSRNSSYGERPILPNRDAPLDKPSLPSRSDLPLLPPREGSQKDLTSRSVPMIPQIPPSLPSRSRDPRDSRPASRKGSSIEDSYTASNPNLNVGV